MTRSSIKRLNLSKKMDCRVKPGNDGLKSLKKKIASIHLSAMVPVQQLR
jgi:hypothetical protein